MQTKRAVLFLVKAVIGLTLVLGGTVPLSSASYGPQASTDWRGEYYANPDLVGVPTLVRDDASPDGTLGLDFDWGVDAPDPGLPVDGFSARWTRTATFEAGFYRFQVTVDDGIRLYVDGDLVIDEWRDGGQRDRTADYQLTAGTHSLRVEYYERTGVAVARLRWEKVSYPVYPDWRAEYYANPDLNGAPALVRNDRDPNGTLGLNFNWIYDAPASGLPANEFSARWTRTLTFNAGLYRFWATTDDGMRLYVDGDLVINEWRDGSQREVAADRQLTAGIHTLRVEYYERTGVAVAQLRWESVTLDGDWMGEYWANLNMEGSPALTRSDQNVAFDWWQDSPGGTIPSDAFSARWTRRVLFETGSYRFYTLVDDGMRLWLNDRLVIDAWSDHDAAELSSHSELTRGIYTVKIEYYERIGNARIHVWWEKVETPSFPDWKGEYWDNRDLRGDPTLVRNDRGPHGSLDLDFDWGPHAPASELPPDDFSARWTRWVEFDSETYEFHVVADDGVRLWVDGRLEIDAWYDQKPQEYTTDVRLREGTHKLEVEYYEHTGGARILVWWEED